MRSGAVILCGGRSSRMGRDKATLPFGNELMLQRVARLVSEVIEPTKIVVVAAAEQILPPLPSSILLARDVREYRGPLEGIANGLKALGDRADAVYATSCDVPLLVPAFIRRMFDLLEGNDIVVPRDSKFHHPLAAVYRTAVLSQIEQLLTADQLRMQSLLEAVRTREVPVDSLRDVDPELLTLRNCNRPEDYEAALSILGNPGIAIPGSLSFSAE